MVRAEYSTTKQDAFQCSEFPNHLFTRRFTWTDTHMIICSCTDERRSKITAVISEIVKYLQSTKNSTCLDLLQQRASMCEIIRKSYLLKIKLKVRRWDSKKKTSSMNLKNTGSIIKQFASLRFILKDCHPNNKNRYFPLREQLVGGGEVSLTNCKLNTFK